jgi:hypothetical protein
MFIVNLHREEQATCVCIIEHPFADSPGIISKRTKRELRLDDGRVLTPNDLFPLKKKLFVCIIPRNAQTCKIWIFILKIISGRRCKKKLNFSNESPEKPDEKVLKFVQERFPGLKPEKEKTQQKADAKMKI